MKRIAVMFVAVVALVLAAWSLADRSGIFGSHVQLALVAGSENKALEPIVQDWARKNNVDVTIDYLGSVDISRVLEKGAGGKYDAVWPANSLWIELGDSQKVVKYSQSILRSPVVLGLRKSIAQQLGWVGAQDVTVQMIAEAAEAGKFRLAMTSATQSNSGASAYFGFLYALAGSPDVLTQANLEDPALQEAVRKLLGQVDRSSGSSGWLAEALVANPQAYDAMFNYESAILEANQALTAKGEEPLYIIYPSNGLSVADSPLAYVSKGDAEKEKAFQALQAHLLSPEVQKSLAGLGRRAGLIGMEAEDADPQVWRADWGIDLNRAIAPVPTPQSDVIAEALKLYQTDLRKPSLTIWVLDVSGSMEGEPIDKLKQAMHLVLDKDAAALNLLQPSKRDVTVILPFSGTPQQPTIITGDSDTELSKATLRVDQLQAGGGTDLYAALIAAIGVIQTYADNGTLPTYLPAIVAMTDGASDTGNFGAFRNRLAQSGFGKDVPIHSISFGDADEDQLKALSEATIGRMFQSGGNLSDALRQAKGYN